MSKRNKRDFMGDHQDWVDHMYNRGYWINRPSMADLAWWRYTRKHNRFFGLLGMIITGVLLTGMWEPILAPTASNRIDEFYVMQVFATSAVLAFVFIVSAILFFQRTGDNKRSSKKSKPGGGRSGAQ